MACSSGASSRGSSATAGPDNAIPPRGAVWPARPPGGPWRWSVPPRRRSPWQPVVKVILTANESFARGSSSQILDYSTDLPAFGSLIPNTILRSRRRSTSTTDCYGANGTCFRLFILTGGTLGTIHADSAYYGPPTIRCTGAPASASSSAPAGRCDNGRAAAITARQTGQVRWHLSLQAVFMCLSLITNTAALVLLKNIERPCRYVSQEQCNLGSYGNDF